jgi:2-oxoglutarate ferredoxin oxidoreductase subunit gamma
MNGPSLEKFAPTVKKGGIVFINSSLISFGANREDVDELSVPVVDIAKELGNVKAANIVALSAFVARSGIVPMETLKHCIKEEFSKKPKLIPTEHGGRGCRRKGRPQIIRPFGRR